MNKHSYKNWALSALIGVNTAVPRSIGKLFGILFVPSSFHTHSLRYLGQECSICTRAHSLDGLLEPFPQNIEGAVFPCELPQMDVPA